MTKVSPSIIHLLQTKLISYKKIKITFLRVTETFLIFRLILNIF